MHKKYYVKFLIGFIFFILIGILFSKSIFGERIDKLIIDNFSQKSRNEVVIVGIDDKDLKMLGAWPWDRKIFADVLNNLYEKNARLVVFDILFLEERSGDKEMIKVLNENKIPTIFATKFNPEKEIIDTVYKKNEFSISALATVYSDDDGKIRRTNLFQEDKNKNCIKSLAYQAFTIYSKKENYTCEENTSAKLFLYKDQNPKTYSIVDILENKISEKDLSGKVVFIGSNTVDILDHFIGRDGEKIPGVFVQANIFQTLLNDSFLKNISIYFVLLIILLFSLFSIFNFIKIKRLWNQIFFMFFGFFILLIIYILIIETGYYSSFSILLFTYFSVNIYTIIYKYLYTESKNKFIKNIFNQYVSEEVLNNILEKENLELSGEKKYLSILFSDIRGFTTLTESLSAEELVENLNVYFEAMNPIIMQNEGYIDKFIGDAIMAFWNAPLSVENHEEKAVISAIEMIKTLKELNESKKIKHPLNIGVGIHAGEVVVGNVGSTKRISYTIIGDSVNATSRIEGLTKKYGVEIIISDTIKNNIKNKNIFLRKIDIVRVKGKNIPIELWSPLSAYEEESLYGDNEKEDFIKINNKAFEKYISGDFENAKKEFEFMKEKYKDKYAEKMIERMDILINKKINEKDFIWENVWDWDEK